jgi:hypothetical protein
MADLLRLRDLTGNALTLLEDSRLLADIGALGSIWPTIASDLARLAAQPALAPGQVLGWLFAHIDDAQVTSLFHAVNQDDLLARLRAGITRLQTLLPGLPQLLAPVSASPAPKVQWQPGTLTTPLTPATDLSLTFALSGGLTCQAGAAWPYKGDGITDPLLMLEANGDIKADATFKLPFSYGSLGVTGGAEARPDIQYYFFESDSNQIFGAALAQAIGRLPDPFDPASVWRAFAHDGLAGMVLGFDGSTSLGVTLTLGKDFDVPLWLTGTLGATIAVDVSRRSLYQLSVHVATRPVSLLDTPRIVMTLSRSDTAEQDWSAGIGLTIDLAPIAAQIHDLLQTQLTGVDAMIARIVPYLSPGTWLAAHAAPLLDSVIARLTTDPILQPALEHDAALLLGQTPTTDDLKTLLLQRITAAIDSVGATGSTAVTDIATSLTNALPALAATGATTRLSDDLTTLIGQYGHGLDTLASTLLDAGGLSAVEDSFAKIGTQLKNVANPVLDGLHDIITRYDALAHKILDFTADQARARIAARISYDAKQTRQAQYELTGTFTSLSDAAGDLYRALSFGQLNAIRQALTGKVSGFTLNEAASSITRIAGVSETLGYELLLFGLELTGSDVLSAQAQVSVTPAGTIQIAAQGSFARSMQIAGASRSLTFFTACDVLRSRSEIAAGRPTIRLGLTATHADSDLKLSDVTGFLDRLVDFGLISDQRRQSANGIMTGWTTTRGKNTPLAGRLTVAQNFNASDIAALLALGSAIGDPRMPSAAGLSVFRQGAQALFYTQATSAGEWGRQVGDFDYRSAFKQTRAQYADNLDFAYRVTLNPALKQTLVGLSIGQGGPRGTMDPVIGDFLQTVNPLLDMIDLLSRFNQLYQATPPAADPAGALNFYKGIEKTIASDAAPWLSLNSKLVFGFNPHLHRRTVALFLLLASLARDLAPDAPGHLFDDMFVITLSQGDSGPTVSV